MSLTRTQNDDNNVCHIHIIISHTQMNELSFIIAPSRNNKDEIIKQSMYGQWKQCFAQVECFIVKKCLLLSVLRAVKKSTGDLVRLSARKVVVKNWNANDVHCTGQARQDGLRSLTSRFVNQMNCDILKLLTLATATTTTTESSTITNESKSPKLSQSPPSPLLPPRPKCTCNGGRNVRYLCSFGKH